MNKTRHNGVIFEHFFTGEKYPRLSEKLTSLRTVGGFFVLSADTSPSKGFMVSMKKVYGFHKKGQLFLQKG